MLQQHIYTGFHMPHVCRISSKNSSNYTISLDINQVQSFPGRVSYVGDGCDPWLDKCHRVIELLVDLLGAVVHLMVCNHLASGLLWTLWYSIYD